MAGLRRGLDVAEGVGCVPGQDLACGGGPLVLMPEDLRPVALQALDEQATFRVVLLTRSHEMAAAATKGHLSGAAALELRDLSPSEDAATGHAHRRSRDFPFRCSSEADAQSGLWRAACEQPLRDRVPVAQADTEDIGGGRPRELKLIVEPLGR